MQEKNKLNLQDAFLNTARRDGVPVSIYVTNGYLINGARVLSFDNYSMLVESNGKQMLIYKHAVSTITPDTPIKVFTEEKNEP